jgi:hypothetical protein
LRAAVPVSPFAFASAASSAPNHARRIERGRNLGHILQGPRYDSRQKIRRRQNQDAEQDRGHGAAGLRQCAKARGRHRANHDGRKNLPAQAA